MNPYLTRFLFCFLLVLPSWLAGAVQNMANFSDLVVTAGFAASLAWVLGLARSGSAGFPHTTPSSDPKRPAVSIGSGRSAPRPRIVL